MLVMLGVADGGGYGGGDAGYRDDGNGCVLAVMMVMDVVMLVSAKGTLTLMGT